MGETAEIFGFSFVFRDALSSVYEISMVGISFSYKYKQIGVYFLEESSMSMNFLAPETSHIMA